MTVALFIAAIVSLGVSIWSWDRRSSDRDITPTTVISFTLFMMFFAFAVAATHLT